MSLSAVGFAELAEEVYNRSPLDQSLTVPGISRASGDSLALFGDVPVNALQAAGFAVDQASGLIYSANGSGFAAQIVVDQTTNNYTVVFRGTDFVGPLSPSNDFGDLGSDISLIAGTTGRSQFDDALALMSVVQATVVAEGGDPSQTTVTGQSLGGGLAGLVGATLGIQTYMFDPAPFGQQLVVLADEAAAAQLNLAIPTDNFGLDRDVLRTALGLAGFGDDQVNAFIETSAGLLNVYQTSLASTGHIYRIAGEALSNSDNWLGNLLNVVGAQAFDGADSDVINLGSGDPILLHSPALLALALVRSDLGTVTRSDAALRDAMFGSHPEISGPVSHASADPSTIDSTTITSKSPGGLPDPGVLDRALLQDDALYANFRSQFGNLLEHGAAATGWDPNGVNVNNGSLHTAVVDLGLQVVRDGLTVVSGQVSAAAENVFEDVQNGIVVDNGINADAAIIHLADITSNGAPVGVQDLDAILGQALNAAGVGLPALSWSTLIVQDEADNASMFYKPIGMDIDLKELIFCGSGGDAVCASAAGDIIVGGVGNDTFHLGNNYSDSDGNPISDNVGSVVLGGGGLDTAYYSNSNVAIDVELGSLQLPSNGSATVRHDLLSGISVVYGSNNDGDVIKAVSQFSALPSTEPAGYEIHAGNGNSDTLAGGAGNDTILGGAGNDTIWASGGTDVINGGAGENTLNLSPAPATGGWASIFGFGPGEGYVVDLSAGSLLEGAAGSASLANIQDVVGSAYDDQFTAGGGTESFNGESGTNTLALSGAWDSYDIESNVNGFDWMFASSLNGDIDYASNIQSIKFADGTMGVANLLNSAPTISGGPFNGTYHQGDTLPVTGSVSFSDPDVADEHTVSETLSIGFLGDFVASLTQDTNGTGSGTLGWQFAVDDSAIRYLAAGQHITETAEVVVTDLHGATAETDVVIEIDGINDAPQFATGAIAGSASELASTSGSSHIDTASGSVGFTDADLTDTHVTTVSELTAAVSGGIAIPNATLAALASAVTATETDSTGTGAGSVGWNFGIADQKLDFLAAGQTLTASYDPVTTDNNGASATKEVDVTVTGANDAPVLSGGTASGSVTDAQRTASGVLDFTDPDTIDTHTITGVHLVSGGPNGAMGTLTATLAHDSTGNATGLIDWSYGLTGVPAVSQQEVWAVSVSDGHSTTTENVTINTGPASNHPNGDQLPISFSFNERVFENENSNDGPFGSIIAQYANPSGPVPGWLWTVVGPSNYAMWNFSLEVNGGIGSARAHNGDMVTLIGVATNGSNEVPLANMPHIEITIPIETESQVAWGQYKSIPVAIPHVELA